MTHLEKLMQRRGELQAELRQIDREVAFLNQQSYDEYVKAREAALKSFSEKERVSLFDSLS